MNETEPLKPADILAAYKKAPRALTPEFLDGINYAATGGLASEVVFALSYMQRIEDAVWGVYLKQLRDTATGRNPFVATFLDFWDEEEGRHADVLARVLEVNGGPLPLDEAGQDDPDWLIRRMPESLIGPIHMSLGAANELMTLYGYSRLADKCDNPELARILRAIKREESIHYSFYFRMARYYLSRSWIARKATVRVANREARGVGVGVLTAENAHRVMRFLFEDDPQGFIDAVQTKIAKLPGFASFDAIETLLVRAEIPLPKAA